MILLTGLGAWAVCLVAGVTSSWGLAYMRAPSNQTSPIELLFVPLYSGALLLISINPSQ